MSEDIFQEGERVPIAPCVRCGSITEDPTRDVLGEPMPAELFDADEQREAVCQECRVQEIGEAFEEDFMELLERRLGLAEKHRDALKAFIETIFTDPDKILKLDRLNDRVGELDRELKRQRWALGLIVAIFGLLLYFVS